MVISSVYINIDLRAYFSDEFSCKRIFGCALFKGSKVHVSNGRYEKSNGRYEKSNGRYEKSNGRYEKSNGRYEKSNGRYEKSNGRYEKSNGIFLSQDMIGKTGCHIDHFDVN